MEDSGIDSDPKPIQDERLGCGVPSASFQTSDSSCSSTSVPSPQKTNLKQLHRKLERRIEQAKKVQRLQEYKKSSGLIPIQRLPIPSKTPAAATSKEHHPLVDWDSEDSEEDINFFPVKMRDGRQELTDTFSIENLPLSGGEEDEDDLDLLPPQKPHRKWGCCGLSFSTRCSII
ncbi:uncharacterized protein LOC117647800 [Thrips palmi]|uniref:Uncharacterized protein LOC117647800 n=1 Tax=Thrips palmi TaxID=161013 RepID=A0A6P8Z634_THRPL|nr:uncharacterized protein LOC117647800 [Thrips palmi]